LTNLYKCSRGKTKNGDVDLIISSKRPESMTGFLNKLTRHLTEKNYIKHKLWYSTEIKKSCHVEKPSAGGKQVFDTFEKVISYYNAWL
jgi:hypothetical protein